MTARSFVPVLLGTACALLAHAPRAQGFEHGVLDALDIGAATRGLLGDFPGELVGLVRSGDYTCLGRDDSVAPGAVRIEGVDILVQDRDGSTVENFDLVFYNEDPMNADLPDLTTGVGTINGALQGPSGAGPVAMQLQVTFQTPVQLSDGLGIFAGADLPGATTTDGLRLQAQLGGDFGPAFPQYDVAGNGLSATRFGTYSFTIAATTVAANPPLQIGLDLRTPEAGLTVRAVTNQMTAPISNSAPGTASFFSGVNPDAASPPLNAGRADEVGVVARRSDMAGENVFFLLDGVGLGPGLALSSVVPGSSGMFCLLSPATFATAVADMNGEAAFQFGALSPMIRAGLSGVTLRYQAIYSAAAGTFHATNVGVQRF